MNIFHEYNNSQFYKYILYLSLRSDTQPSEKRLSSTKFDDVKIQ